MVSPHFHSKIFIPFLLILVFFFGPGNSQSQENHNDNKNNKNTKNKNNKNQEGVFKEFSLEGQSIAAIKHQASLMGPLFMGDPDEKFLSSAEGQNAKALYNKLKSYILIHDQIQSCSDGDGDIQSLEIQLLEAASKVAPQDLSCAKKYGEALTDEPALQKALMMKSLTQMVLFNSLNNYADFYYRLRGDKDLDSQALADKICEGTSSFWKKENCDQETKILLAHTLEARWQGLKNKKEVRLNVKSATTALNQKIHNLNRTLALVEQKIALKPGTHINLGVWDNYKPTFSPEAELLYQIYLNEYLMTLDSPTGPLLLTESLKKKVGAFRLKDEDLKKTKAFPNLDSVFHFPQHGQVGRGGVEKGIKEADQEILQEVKKLFSYWDYWHKGKLPLENEKTGKDQGGQVSTHLAYLLQYQPLTVGQYLLNNPEFTPQVCQMIKDLKQSEKTKKTFKKVMVIVPTVLGVVLLLSGAGTIAGMALLHTTTALAILSTIGTVTTVSGIVLKVGGLSFTGAEVYQNRSELLKLERSYLAGGGDAQTVIKARQVLQEFEKTKSNLATMLGFSAVDFGLMGTNIDQSIQLGQSAAQSLQEIIGLGSINKTIQPILERDINRQIFQELRKKRGGPYVISLLLQLSREPKKTREKFLQAIPEWDGQMDSWDAFLESKGIILDRKI